MSVFTHGCHGRLRIMIQSCVFYSISCWPCVPCTGPNVRLCVLSYSALEDTQALLCSAPPCSPRGSSVSRGSQFLSLEGGIRDRDCFFWPRCSSLASVLHDQEAVLLGTELAALIGNLGAECPRRMDSCCAMSWSHHYKCRSACSVFRTQQSLSAFVLSFCPEPRLRTKLLTVVCLCEHASASAIPSSS